MQFVSPRRWTKEWQGGCQHGRREAAAHAPDTDLCHVRMSRAGWPPSGAARPPALVPPPTADSIAYRRYLRYLPEYRSRRREEEPRGAQKSGEQRQDDDDDEGEEKDCGEKSVEGEKEGGDGAILVSPDVSVSSLVQQYTNMLHARNTSSDAPYNFSRSCSNLPTQCRRPSASLSGGTPPDGEQPRKGSLHCRSGAPNQVRCRSLSLPWPSESSWRWHSEPGLACQDQASGVAVSDAAPPHAASLANLDSATSDEGCPGDDVSTGPSPLPSPDCSVAHRLSGLITPFRSLSPASSVGSHLGSVEDLPLVRSMSAGHVLDSLRRSHSADSAVEVEDEATSPMGSPLNDDPGVAEDSCEVPDEPGEGEDEGQVFCECPATNFAEVNGDGDDKSDEHRVTLRLKSGDGRRSGFSERRRGEVNGDALLRLMRGCGVVGCGQRQQAREGGVLRTPSVVISDYSGDTVSLTVALASSDFSLSHLDGLQHSASSPSLIPPADDFSSRKVSSCSSCSSVSTVDFTTPLTFTPLLRRTHSPVEESHNRISTTSTYSYLSNSEDEVEHVLTRPQTPRKESETRAETQCRPVPSRRDLTPRSVARRPVARNTPQRTWTILSCAAPSVP
ncbi:uncharacterized protein LOC135089192 isoform X1 [Scylla paramamosain]|uniref:uncharacterized protein LOC135089192 isoform X1 n=2 Tax=Scylla paramamosain TaxID=85552 RepID=UPI003083DDF5